MVAALYSGWIPSFITTPKSVYSMDRFGLQTSLRMGRGDTGDGDCRDYPADNESLGKIDGDVAQGVRAKGIEILSNCDKKLGGSAVTKALAAWFFGTFADPGLG